MFETFSNFHVQKFERCCKTCCFSRPVIDRFTDSVKCVFKNYCAELDDERYHDIDVDKAGICEFYCSKDVMSEIRKSDSFSEFKLRSAIIGSWDCPESIMNMVKIGFEAGSH